ncbi:MAG: glycosyltransferase family 8 protein [Alphaproteobacteria bacterium]|nr:glycosyltransferase family 8 protein [Alphaproteobacteria bacterium]
MNKEVVNVCLSTNDAWAPFAAVTIASIMSNTKSRVHFFILHTNLSNNNIAKISAISKKYTNAQIEYISIDKEKLQEFSVDIRYISNDAFSRLLFPNLCSRVDKVIYTDVDVVFKGDIKELFKENLQDNIIGAVEGISHADRQDNLRLKIDKHHNYFQSGLLLIDCKKWREKDITSSCYAILEKGINLRYGDQDLLNIVFVNNYRKLHQKYCVIPLQLDKMQKFSKDSREALADPFIIHYAGGNKPWITSGSLEDDFWKYASMTDFFLDIIKMRLNSDFISKERDVIIKQCKLFGIIPLIKIKRKLMYSEITDRYFLFNFIPILKKVEDVNSITWTSFFDFPVLHLKKKRNEQHEW